MFIEKWELRRHKKLILIRIQRILSNKTKEILEITRVHQIKKEEYIKMRTKSQY